MRSVQSENYFDMARYFMLDMGKEMIKQGIAIEQSIRESGDHITIYLTDSDKLLCLEEISEDEFLDLYKNTDKNGKA